MTLYGLSTCDSCRKALAALRAQGWEVRLHDLRAEPLPKEEIARLWEMFGDRLVNRSSATWRGLSEEERARPAMALLAGHPALMKRPVIVADGRMTLGWKKAAQAAWA